MKAGKMDERITIQTLTQGTGSIGNPTESWADLATVWADVQPETGKEILETGGSRQQLENGREITERRARFFIRHRSDVTTKHRISYDSELWDIESIRVVDKDKRKDGLEILAKVIK